MIRAFIREDFIGRSIVVALIQEGDGGHNPARILRIVEGGNDTVYRWEDLPDPPVLDTPPSFQLGDAEARALLEALTRHYHGAEDTSALRKDYDAERKRVDDLTTSLTSISSALAERQPYDNAGMLPSGWGAWRNDTGKPVPVRTAAQIDRAIQDFESSSRDVTAWRTLLLNLGYSNADTDTLMKARS